MKEHSIFPQFLAGLLLLPMVAVPAAGAPPTVNGRLETIGPFRVLRVWGTPEEMGFAHGYLVGKGYIAATKEYLSNDALCESEKRSRGFPSAVRIPERAQEEIEGIFKGIVAAEGAAPLLPCVDRPLTLDDLLLDNAGDLIRAFACSGFTVWGDKAGEAGVITTRNLDYPVGGPVGLEEQMILVRHPKGKNQVAMVTWPGLIAAFTGINQHGVCTFMHTGNGRIIRTPKASYTPVALVLTDLLETARPADAHSLAETLLKQISPYAFTYLVRVVRPRVPGGSDMPERVFRIDASGVSENPGGSLACVTTNHYFDAAQAPIGGVSHSTMTRYSKLVRDMPATVTPQTAWEALRSVAPPLNIHSGTLHSLVVYPERRELDLAFATWKDKVISAPVGEPTRISFDELFGAHD